MALRFIVSWSDIRRNYLFVLISTLSCTVPYFLLAQWNYEFPALVGGATGLVLSVIVARSGFGLVKTQPTSDAKASSPVAARDVFKAMTPTILLIVILIVTRIKQFGIKSMLTDSTEMFSISFGPLGDFSISQALIFKLSHILGTDVSWAYKTLYVPALIPFLLVVLISIPLFRLPTSVVKQMFAETGSRIKMPFIALVGGALIMVKLMMTGGENSPNYDNRAGIFGSDGNQLAICGGISGSVGGGFLLRLCNRIKPYLWCDSANYCYQCRFAADNYSSAAICWWCDGGVIWSVSTILSLYRQF